MLKNRIRKALALPSALLLPLLLIGCATAGNPNRPAEARLEPVGLPTVPAGTVPCTSSPTGKCLSDAQNASLLTVLVDKILEADRKLCWLHAYHGYGTCEDE